jgi:hypothetical protein
MALVKYIVDVLVWNVGAGVESLVGLMWEVVVWWREWVGEFYYFIDVCVAGEFLLAHHDRLGLFVVVLVPSVRSSWLLGLTFRCCCYCFSSG